MFMKMSEYMQRPLFERRAHIDLDESCIEIGTTYSREYRGLLAHFLKTMLPTKKEAILCHACNNDACSNARHLYWGTYTENLKDAFTAGRKVRVLSTAESKKMLEARKVKLKAHYASGEAASLSKR